MKYVIKDNKAKQAVIAHIDGLIDGNEYEVSISRKLRLRTVPQNRLYWLYLSCIEDETGMDKEDLHTHFKQKYLKQEDLTIGSDTFIKTVTTKKLTTMQFTDYINKIRIFSSSELAIILPDPADILWEQFYERYKHTLCTN